MSAAVRTKCPLRQLPSIAGRIVAGFTLMFLMALPAKANVMENHFLYFPDPHLHLTPARAGLEFEEVTFPAADGTLLHGWFVPGAPNRPTVLFFHGNAGNISHRVENLVQLHRQGYSTLIFDYRGYGRSRGEPSEPGLYADGRGALDWLKSRGTGPDTTIYFGRSLGAAVALQLALEEPPAAVILESAFTSLAAMGREHYPILYTLLGWLVPARYDNAAKIGQLDAPLLLIHGSADTIVPVRMGRRLFELAPEPKRLYLIENADHNDAYFLGDGDYWQAWRDFLQIREHLK